MISKQLFFIACVIVSYHEATDLNAYLTHYWPITSSDMTDQIGTAHMTQGTATNFVSDRFGCPYSALNLNGGYTQVPAGYYFYSPTFTVSAWVYPINVGGWARVFDFANGGPLDNILFSLSSSTSLAASLQIFLGTTRYTYPESSTLLMLNKWQFVTGTYDGSSMSVYIDGVFTGSTPLSCVLPKIWRT